MASSYISRTFGTPTDEDKWTLSFWYKKCSPTAGVRVLDADGGGNEGNISFDHTTGKLNFYQYPGGTQLITSNYYRDVGAFYHVVVIFDAANGTASDRAQIWVNGERVTTLGTASYPTTLYSRINKSGVVHYIGAKGSTSSMYCDGVFSHMNFVDGSALAPSYFGETDSTSGIWKIKTSPSVTYGNNGFFLKFEDRTNLDLDSSPNAHTFTTTGTITATKDNPSNNFCTMNPLDNYWRQATFSNGNNTTVGSASTSTYSTGTLAFMPNSAGTYSGKWYWEAKVDAAGDPNYFWGIVASQSNATTDHLVDTTNSKYIYDGSNGKVCRPASAGSCVTYGDTYTTGDYLGIYLDFDNSKIYFSKNGTIQNSGTGVTIDASLATSDGGLGRWTPTLGNGASSPGSGGNDCSWNFGNGTFGSTVLTGTTYSDDDGIGTFKYSPNDGGASSFDSSAKNFMAFCTKNLKLYG